jgi:hypothetical protein
MAIPHAHSGEVVDVCPLGPALANARTSTLVKSKTLEIIRLVVPAGKEIPAHAVSGEVVLQRRLDLADSRQGRHRNLGDIRA